MTLRSVWHPAKQLRWARVLASHAGAAERGLAVDHQCSRALTGTLSPRQPNQTHRLRSSGRLGSSRDEQPQVSAPTRKDSRLRLDPGAGTWVLPAQARGAGQRGSSVWGHVARPGEESGVEHRRHVHASPLLPTVATASRVAIPNRKGAASTHHADAQKEENQDIWKLGWGLSEKR